MLIYYATVIVFFVNNFYAWLWSDLQVIETLSNEIGNAVDSVTFPLDSFLSKRAVQTLRDFTEELESLDIASKHFPRCFWKFCALKFQHKLLLSLK